MDNIFEEFCELFDAHGEAPKRSQHYPFTGYKSERISEGVRKLIRVFVSHEVKFYETDLVFNVITKKVPPEKFPKEYLEIEDDGNKLHKLFIEERIVGSKAIWDTIKKRKLPTFANNVKIVTMKVKSQLVNVKAFFE